jgi:hypothetical protein
MLEVTKRLLTAAGRAVAAGMSPRARLLGLRAAGARFGFGGAGVAGFR